MEAQTALPQNILPTHVVRLRTHSADSAPAPESGSRSALKKLLLQKQAKVGVIGLGYVGLPLSVAFSESGYSVTGFDNNPTKVATLMKGVSYI